MYPLGNGNQDQSSQDLRGFISFSSLQSACVCLDSLVMNTVGREKLE